MQLFQPVDEAMADRSQTLHKLFTALLAAFTTGRGSY
jgi:hypothetical protein